MSDEARERNLGEQPIARLLTAHGLKAQDLVAASTEGLTHKMVARACKGRWLTPNTRGKVWRALNGVSGKTYALNELFNYQDSPPPPCPAPAPAPPAPAPSRADDHNPP